MALRKLPAVAANQVNVGMMVRIVEPNGASIPEVKAAGGGEMYARGAYGRVMEIPGGNGMGVKFDSTMLHDLQPKGYVKLTEYTQVEQLEFDSRSDLLEAAALFLNDYTEQSQSILNSGRQAFVEAAVANLTFEHNRLADMIEEAGFELDKEIPGPIRNYGDGRLEREAERQRQLEADAARTDDGDDEGDDDQMNEEEDDDNRNVFQITGPNYNPNATLQAGTTDADGVVTLDNANLGPNGYNENEYSNDDADGLRAPVDGATLNEFDRVHAVAVVMGEARDGEPAVNENAQGHDAYIPAGMPSIPDSTVDVRTNHADTVASISTDVPEEITADDIGIGSDINDDEEEGDEQDSAPRA